MICVLLSSMLVIKVSRLKPTIQNRLMSTAYTVFLLIILFSSQRLSTYALNFINCEWLGSGHYLYIDTTVKCYQTWQIFVLCYIGLFILPLWSAFFLGPGLLAAGKITVRTFLLGLLFPGPFVFYCVWLIWKERYKPVPVYCQDLTTTAVLNEVWCSFKPFPSSIYLCWGGIIELRRLASVFCATLIPTPVARLICMVFIVFLAVVVHVKFHPYVDSVANACANISLSSTLMVGLLNFGWATFLYSAGDINYGDAKLIGEGLITLENILIQLFPVAAVVFLTGYFLYVNLVSSHD